MRTPPLLADFSHARACKPFCENSLTLPRPRIAGGDLPQGKRIPMVLWRENGSDQQKTVLLNLSFSRAVSLVLCNHSSEYCMKHDLVLNQYQQAK